MDTGHDGRELTPRSTAPPESPRKLLAARLIALGAIPIAVFCAMFVLMRALIGAATVNAQAWTLWVSLGASIASLFVLASLASRAVIAEVNYVREALRGPLANAAGPEMPELMPPLEDLKNEVLAVSQQLQEREARLQERLDTARQQIFFLTNNDALTGLPNRKTLEERLESALSSAKSQGSAHALLYLDVDFFHRINDSFGHLAGDELLRRITPVLQGTLREGELLARIGGDEFAVLLENCGADYAHATATQLRDAVQMWQFEWDGKAFQVGVSVGIVAITRLAPSLSALLSEADRGATASSPSTMRARRSTCATPAAAGSSASTTRSPRARSRSSTSRSCRSIRRAPR